jgi:hypothetical protein
LAALFPGAASGAAKPAGLAVAVESGIVVRRRLTPGPDAAWRP